MNENVERLYQFLEAADLDPERIDDRRVQYWFKEERYYLRLLDQQRAVQIVHPRVWQVGSHLEFGVATFVSNDLNQDGFAAKLFVNNDEQSVYAVADIFVREIDSLQETFVDYMNAMSWAIVEFRNRTEASMAEEESREAGET